MISLPSKEQFQSYFFDGAWSFGLASVITGGMVSPLTLIISSGLFAMQAVGGFPVTKILSTVREHMADFLDSDYQPNEAFDDTSEDHDFKYDDSLEDNDPINDPTAPIHEGIRAQLFETQVESYLPAKGIRRVPGMTWLLGEQAVRYTLPILNPVEIMNTSYGCTRSGKVNFKVVDKNDSELSLKLR